MILVNDKDNPALIGILDDPDEFFEITDQVQKINQDLVDSGFNQYKFKAIKRGNKAYIERV